MARFSAYADGFIGNLSAVLSGRKKARLLRRSLGEAFPILNAIHRMGKPVGIAINLIRLIIKNQSVKKNIWRTERDSNPRYAFTYTRVPGVRLQPLGHLSVGNRFGGHRWATNHLGFRARIYTEVRSHINPAAELFSECPRDRQFCRPCHWRHAARKSSCQGPSSSAWNIATAISRCYLICELAPGE